ncbi:MAG: alpha-isopropylmalate synthase regulatory domain-containing protein, partial [Ginsengibacter sp.]
DLKKVTQRIIELGDRKETVTQADLPYIISDILDSNTIDEKVQIKNYVLTHSKKLRPSVTLSISIEGEIFEEHAQCDGQYDAFVNALNKIYKHKKIELPELVDYAVRIPPGGKSDALCETIITWTHNCKEFKTRGLDSDQTVAAIKATEKMLNQI